MKMRAVFVVLHYLVADVTSGCIDSILQSQSATDYQIVVVDNYSNNLSLERLKARFSGLKNIFWLESDANLGFAKGNNLGIRFAHDQLNADFVIVMNNDVEIEQRNFIDQIESEYARNPFDILGPDIVSLSHDHQNPKSLTGPGKTDILKRLKKIRTDRFLIKTHLYELIVLKNKLIQSLRHPSSGEHAQITRATGRMCEEPHDNCVLHGACVIFSARYLNLFNGFFSQTFLYAEEEILWYVAAQEHLVIRYSPKLKVNHQEDQSTRSMQSNLRKKRIFKLTHEANSLEKFIQIMDDARIYQMDMRKT